MFLIQNPDDVSRPFKPWQVYIMTSQGATGPLPLSANLQVDAFITCLSCGPRQELMKLMWISLCVCVCVCSKLRYSWCRWRIRSNNLRDTRMNSYLKCVCITLVLLFPGCTLFKYSWRFCHPPQSRTAWPRSCCPTTGLTEQLLFCATTSGRRQRPLISPWLTFKPR